MKILIATLLGIILFLFIGICAIELPVKDKVDAALNKTYLQVVNLAQTSPYNVLSDPDVAFMAAAYHVLSTTIEYPDDIEGLHSNDRYGALVLNKSMCLGDALTYKELLDRANIPNYVACGFASDKVWHAWNEIYYKGQWFSIDITSGSLKNGRTSPVVQTAYKVGGYSISNDFFHIESECDNTTDYTKFFWNDWEKENIEKNYQGEVYEEEELKTELKDEFWNFIIENYNYYVFDSTIFTNIIKATSNIITNASQSVIVQSNDIELQNPINDIMMETDIIDIDE